jgi:hypothetical protein
MGTKIGLRRRPTCWSCPAPKRPRVSRRGSTRATAGFWHVARGRRRRNGKIEPFDCGADVGGRAAGEAVADDSAFAVGNGQRGPKVAPAFPVRWHGTAAEKASAGARASQAPSDCRGVAGQILPSARQGRRSVSAESIGAGGSPQDTDMGKGSGRRPFLYYNIADCGEEAARCRSPKASACELTATGRLVSNSTAASKAAVAMTNQAIF